MRAFTPVAVALLLAAVAELVPRAALALDDPGWVSRVTMVGADGGNTTFAVDSANRLQVRPVQRDAPCTALAQTVVACGTTPVTVPTSRAYMSIGVEITNSAENTGSPKMKCVADPVDGGVGFGLTFIGDVRAPGEGYNFGLDSTHTVKCVCDTAGTALTTSECQVY